MKKQIIYTACLLIACTGLVSCSGLKSKYYVGEMLNISEGDLGLESVWLYGDDTYYLRRTGTNAFVLANMGWNQDTGDYSVKSYPLVPSQLGDHLFLNIKGPDLYTIFRVVLSDEDELVLFRVNRKKVEQDIAKGIVSAYTNEHDVVLNCTKEEQDAYILKNIDSIFSIDSARVARKLSEKQTKEASSQ